MSARHHFSSYDCGQEVERLEACQSVTIVAAAMGVSKSVYSRLKKSAECRNALKKHAVGLRGSVSPDFMIMDNNAQSCRSIEVSVTLQSENILHMQ
ncbi:hypothetical protein TNCV_3157661 [Trichonephila clavipes]|nr:hypothetical protein TNCV_3157661 [Trichonephila clavipes]